MRTTVILLLLIGACISCTRVKNTAKEVLNKSGEAVGSSSSEFIEGITEGVQRTIDCEIILSDKLKEKGIETGKFSVHNDSIGNANNVLALYLIFNKDFEGEIMAKALDKKGLEFGRCKLKLEGTEGDAKFVDFVFDKRTNIEVKSKIYIE